jgi:hypothetical protein
MPGYTEASGTPGAEEPINTAPSIERDAKGVIAQDAVKLLEGGGQPAIFLVIGDAAARPVLVVHQIRRVGENEIHGPIGQRGQYGEAVP